MAEHANLRMEDQPASYPKTAACACGGLTVSVVAAPQIIHACACLDCQRRSGSAFSYSAFFKESTVRIEGDSRTWRRSTDSGRWHDAHFCPTCGICVFVRLEALPKLVCVSVGCFAESSFQGPVKLYWTSRRHDWLDLPDGIERIETQ
jgi:hypothetical protein